MNQRIVTLFFLLAAFTGWLPSVRAALPTLQESLEIRVESQLAVQSPETWELVDVHPFGFLEDGTPLALFVFVKLPDAFDLFAPVSTRAGPKTHTRVLYVVQPVLGLDIIQATGWDPLSGGRPSPVLMTPGPASTGILTGLGLEVLDMPGPDVSGAIHDQNTLAMIADRMHSINMSNWITARNGGSNFIPHVVNFHFLEEAGDLSYYRNEIGEFIIPSQMSGQFGFDGGRTANMFEYASIHINLHGSGALEDAGGLSQFTYGVSDFFADTDMKIAAYGIAKWLKTEDGSAYLAEHKGETLAAIAAGAAAYYAVKKAAPWMKGKLDEIFYAPRGKILRDVKLPDWAKGAGFFEDAPFNLVIES